jgi:hypothetical protein
VLYQQAGDPTSGNGSQKALFSLFMPFLGERKFNVVTGELVRRTGDGVYCIAVVAELEAVAFC